MAVKAGSLSSIVTERNAASSEKGKRRTGRAYRREKTHCRKKRACEMNQSYVYAFPCGSVKDRGKGKYFVTHRSRKTGFFKRHSNKIVRRNNIDPSSSRSHYRKEFDYWWTID